MPEPRFLLLFLGNPGERYSRTRHNLGFMTGERFLLRAGGGRPVERFNGRFWLGTVESTSVAALFPLTFMNSSGEAAFAAAEFYKITVENIVAVHDDLDLEFGRLRVRRGGASGGHLGVESIITELQGRDFIRLRLGVGRPPAGVAPIDFVLSEFLQEERPQVDDLVDRAADGLFDLLRHPLERVMNDYNRANPTQ